MNWNGRIDLFLGDQVQSIGILGGTFDPPHIAHLVLASEAQAQLCLERVLWVLTPVPPHKPHRVISPVAIRREMVQAAILDNPTFEFSSVDIDRDPPHYAVETMVLLHQRYPDAELIYLMGEDSLRDLPRWHQPEVFIQQCAFLGIMHRAGASVALDDLKAILPGLEQKIRYINVPLLQLSSTDIRQRVAQGRAFQYYLPDNVYQLVLKYHIYQDR